MLLVARRLIEEARDFGGEGAGRFGLRNSRLIQFKTAYTLLRKMGRPVLLP